MTAGADGNQIGGTPGADGPGATSGVVSGATTIGRATRRLHRPRARPRRWSSYLSSSKDGTFWPTPTWMQESDMW